MLITNDQDTNYLPDICIVDIKNIPDPLSKVQSTADRQAKLEHPIPVPISLLIPSIEKHDSILNNFFNSSFRIPIPVSFTEISRNLDLFFT